jgi:lysophospholipase L1-like esterase
MGAKLKIVGLGDSTTAGTPEFRSQVEAPPAGRGNPESQYCYWMMKAHPNWEVLNKGVNGQRSDEILSRFERDVLRETPSLVIVLAGVNDIFQRYPTAVVKKNLKAMYDIAEKNRILPVAATVLPYNIASPGEAEAISDLNAWVESEARASGRLFCDTNLAVRDPNNPELLASTRDGLHPDVTGYRRMGDALAATLERAGY